MNLNGKIALVTGSTSGIGLGIARVLAKSGAQLILNGFGDSGSAREEIAQLGKKPGYHDADLRDVLQIEAMMRYAESQFGGVDILVNNAGIQHVAPVETFPVEKWNDIIAINLSAVFHTSRLALPAMREQNWGRIINIASVHGLVASKEKSAYVAAKHGVVGFTKSLALETARTGVTANALCPGWVLTRWYNSKSISASRMASRRNWRKTSFSGKSSLQVNLSPRSSWANWRCFYAATAPLTFAAPRGIWMAAGWHSEFLAG